MAIIKCKMCGGDIELSDDKTYGMCEFCGSTMTFPKVDDDQRAAAFNRGNHFRRIGEFDKALAVYERIVREDDTDAEAHWCCALCRFGIEYVEDPATFEWLPTCHRASFDSFLEDVDYLAAVEHSDGVTRRQYQKDGAKIAEVQRGILATSQNTEPYDVFICYKESDENGGRTRDSLMAQDIYYQLTEQGRKVFFARITLEDVVGTQYEPYIFAALNSAKVMIVVGTKPEYLNAVWVKNEWSRFLAMMKKDRHKLLLPCYRDMDPYDLPEQLSVLQSYDMAKIGFIQDLTRGIAKVLDADKKPEKVKETVVVQQAAAPAANTAPLLKRAFIFLEDGDWSSANEYCEKVLDIDPENAQAYLGKLMAELRVKRQENLKDCAQPFDGSNNYQKALRFGDEKLKADLEGYIAHIKERNENERLEGIYTKAKAAMSGAHTENAYKEAARLFASVNRYKDSAQLAKACLEKAEDARKDAILNDGKKSMTGSSVSGYEKALALFESIPGWKDADEKIAACHEKIAELKAILEADRLEKERKAELARKEAKRIAKRNKKIALIVTPIICVILAVAIVMTQVIIPNNNYKKAVALMEDGKYTEAIAAFEALDGHKDSEKKIAECIIERDYVEAITLMDSGDVVSAYEALIALDGYKDSVEKADSLRHPYNVKKLQTAAVGDVVTFGRYEQDNDTANGTENIEWLVLEMEDDKMLVISKYALDCKPYDTTGEKVAWETSTLRQWLNNDFVNAAFTAEENIMISTVTVSANKNSKYSTPAGKATQDRVFLLSASEAEKYLSSNTAKGCAPTVYADAMGAYVNGSSGNGWWWLRTPGYSQKDATYMDEHSDINMNGYSTNADFVAVRPALWLNVKYAEFDFAAADEKYNDAISLMSAGKYTEAITVFEALGGYRDSADKIDACNTAILEQKYNDAIALLNAGDTARAAMAFGAAGNYKDAQTRSRNLWDKFAVRETISTGVHQTVGIKTDGTVVSVGSNSYLPSNWKNIVAVSVGGTNFHEYWHVVCLKSDGTVVATGDNYSGKLNVGNWKNIVAISAGDHHTVGLRADGTVVAVGSNSSGKCNVSGWKDIVAISAGSKHTVGLRADGTVVAVGDNSYAQCNVSGWENIVAISAGSYHTVGLRADGTVVATNLAQDALYNYGQCEVSGWKNIVAISAGEYHTVGLRADGTVVAVGSNGSGQCKVSGWRNIVAISAGSQYTVGLKADGTVVAVGRNDNGQCNVSGWRNIKLPDSSK